MLRDGHNVLIARLEDRLGQQLVPADRVPRAAGW